MKASARQLTAALGVLVLLVAIARADNVDKLIKDLAKDDYKVRLSAVSSLAKLGDARAINAFIKVLDKDEEKSVRAAAAVGLGKVVTSATDEALRDKAIAALDKASKKDKDSFVKKQAKKSLDKLKKLAEGGDDGGDGGTLGSIYVDIGAMAATIDDGAKEMKDLMKKTVDKTFTKKAPEMTIKWKNAKGPTKKDLKGIAGFHVDGTLTSLTEKDTASATNVSCVVSMYIATFTGTDGDKSAFAFLDGKAKVAAAKGDAKDIALAKKDCVTAVVEDLVTKKIVPAIKAKAE